MDERTCQECGTVIPAHPPGRPGRPRTYCSTQCSGRSARRKGNNNKRRCSVDGCGAPHVARGLCAKHYKIEHQPDRHAKVEMKCAGCGTPVMKQKSGARRPTCSDRCRAYVTFGKWPGAHKELVGPVRFVKSTEPPVVVVDSTRRGFAAGECDWCGVPFVFDFRVGGVARRTCSRQCARRRNRASHPDGRFKISERIRVAIYKRDNWTCQICLEPVEPDADMASDWFPSLDHITPQSQGGSDEPGNLRTAHRWCNSALNDGRRYSEDDFRATA